MSEDDYKGERKMPLAHKSMYGIKQHYNAQDIVYKTHMYARNIDSGLVLH